MNNPPLYPTDYIVTQSLEGPKTQEPLDISNLLNNLQGGNIQNILVSMIPALLGNNLNLNNMSNSNISNVLGLIQNLLKTKKKETKKQVDSPPVDIKTKYIKAENYDF